MDIIVRLFALMQVAIANGFATELSTVASSNNAMPNLLVIINDLGFGTIDPRETPHVRIRICQATMKLRFVVEGICDTESVQVNLNKFWDSCPIGWRNPNHDWVWEVDYEDAEKLLLWTMQRGKDIKCPNILANEWSID